MDYYRNKVVFITGEYFVIFKMHLYIQITRWTPIDARFAFAT